MKRFLYFLISICFSLNSTVLSQNPEWINYTNGQDINSIAIEDDYLWAGTTGGLVKLNKTTGESTFYNKANSGLPGNNISSIAIDGNNNKWIGTSNGLAKFDGTNWTIYNKSNSGLPTNEIICLAIDDSGNKWIGTYYGGLIKYDNTEWTIYNRSNSGLPFDVINCITIDNSGNKWIGTAGSGGFAIFDDTNPWHLFMMNPIPFCRMIIFIPLQ